MSRHQRESYLPPWLLGLLIAVVIFAVALFLLDYFGYGDDPVIDRDSSAVALLL
ncbi:MAG: hypothetical protein ACRDVL_07905 [Acidimicrobiia bacterium]